MATRNVLLFVCDKMADWEAAYAVAGINQPSFQRAPGTYRVATVSGDGLPITTAGGIRIQPELALAAVASGSSAMLILPGSDTWDSDAGRAAVAMAAYLLTVEVPVAAICGATAALARGGLLNDRPHTSNAREFLAATGYAGGVFYQDGPVVSSGNLITASGVAPIEFARAIFERLDLCSLEVLDAWYGLYATKDPLFYQRLIKTARPAAASASA